MAFPNNLSTPAIPGTRLSDVDGNQYQVTAGSIAYFLYSGTNPAVDTVRSILTGGTNNTTYQNNALIYFDGTKFNSSNNLTYLLGVLTYKDGNQQAGRVLTSDVNGNATWQDAAAGGIVSINALTATAQSLATGTSGTNFNISSTTATHTFNLPTASGTNRGALSSTDWTTFNSKIGGSLTTNIIPKANSSNSLTDSLIYEVASKIGINEPTPGADLDIRASSGSFLDVGLRVKNNSGTALVQVTNSGDMGFGTSGAVPLNGSGISMYGAASTSNYIAGFYSGGVAAMIVRGHGTLGGSVGVGTNPPAADTRLHTKGFGNTSATWSFLAQNSTGSDVVSISDNRNLIIGGVTAGDGVNCLTIYNGVAPTGLLNTAQFYALAGEMYVKDEAGNQTQLSPHDRDGYWVYNSVNDQTKKGVRIHMEKLMKKLSEIYGQEFFEEFTV